MSVSLSPLKVQSLIMPLDVFSVLCPVKVTFKLKIFVILRRLSVLDFLLVLTSKVWFLRFFLLILVFQ